MSDKKRRAKSLYADGRSITDIASALGISRATVYNYKAADLKEGVDWDELRYTKQTSAQSTDESEKRFLATLILNFESSMKELEQIDDPKQRLEILTKFVNAYYRIKQPQKSDCKSAKAAGAGEAVYTLSQIAIERHAQTVVQFLGENHDIIVERVLSGVK